MATKNITDRVLREPQSIDAEKAVLGAMLISKDAVPRAMNILIDNSFYDSKHQIIYKNITELFEKNKVIDSISLINNLKKHKELEKVGGAYYITGLSNEAPSFENIEYRGLYDLDKTFIVKSEKANIDNDEPDIVYMTNMHVILYLKDGRIVNILSNKGKYNKASYDCFFEKNVRATDGETKIFSDNLDLLGNESSVKIYNNVSINYPTGSSLQADKIDYDFETKYFKISMFDDKTVKIKVTK